MDQIVVNYTTVRFRPYPETGEFVNVGVVVASPQTGCLDFRIQSRRIRRVTTFFPELDRQMYRSALHALKQHLEQTQAQWNVQTNLFRATTPDQLKAESLRFQEFTRRRESLLQFGELGSILASSLEQALTDLFGRFVDRLFAHEPEYQETVMRQRLHAMMKEWHVSTNFRNEAIGDEQYHVNFPFVRASDKELVIKPLNLDRSDPSDISDHGDQWVNRIARLERRGKLPKQIVFPVAMPQPADSGKLAAAEEILSSLREHHASVPLFRDVDALRAIVTA